MNSNYLSEQSKLMAILKVPLIILVVFIHLIPEDISPISPPLYIVDLQVVIRELISHNIGRIAVPSFFLISGYFLFYKVEKVYSLRIYIANIKKKFITLFIPYLSWNLIYYLFTYIKVTLFNKTGLNVYEYELNTIDTPFYHYLIKPLDYPLWYIRDLISINLIAPIIYFGLRYLRFYFLLIIGLIYHFDFMPNLYVLSDTALYFVSIGAYFSMYKVNFLNIFNKYRYIFISVFIISLILALINNVNTNIEYFIRFYIPFGVFSIFIIIYYLSRYLKDNKKDNIFYRGVFYIYDNIKSAVFFIYAAHTIYLVNWVNSFYMKINLPNTLSYFLAGFTLIIICVFLYKISLKFIPKTISFISGGRG